MTARYALYMSALKVFECAEKIFSRSWDNSDWSFGWGVVNPNLGEEEVIGVADGTIRKSVGDFL